MQDRRTPSTKELVENPEADHPMSSENPLGHQYEDPAQMTPWPAPYNEIRRRPTGDLATISKPPQSGDAQPALPAKRRATRPTNPPPAVPTTRRPSGAVESLALGIFQIGDSSLPKTVSRKPSAEGERSNVSQQWQEHHDNPPPILPRTRRPSEIGDPSIPIPDIPSPPLKGESSYGNVPSSIAKTPVESRDAEGADGVDEHGYQVMHPCTDVPVETQQTFANN